MSSVASLSDILPMSFVGHFVVDRLQLKKKKKKKKKGIDNDVLMFSFVHGRTEAFMEISRGNCITDPRGFKDKTCR